MMAQDTGAAGTQGSACIQRIMKKEEFILKRDLDPSMATDSFHGNNCSLAVRNVFKQ